MGNLNGVSKMGGGLFRYKLYISNAPIPHSFLPVQPLIPSYFICNLHPQRVDADLLLDNRLVSQYSILWLNFKKGLCVYIHVISEYLYSTGIEAIKVRDFFFSVFLQGTVCLLQKIFI